MCPVLSDTLTTPLTTDLPPLLPSTQKVEAHAKFSIVRNAVPEVKEGSKEESHDPSSLADSSWLWQDLRAGSGSGGGGDGDGSGGGGGGGDGGSGGGGGGPAGQASGAR